MTNEQNLYNVYAELGGYGASVIGTVVAETQQEADQQAVTMAESAGYFYGSAEWVETL